jgi:hypothetical protein
MLPVMTWHSATVEQQIIPLKTNNNLCPISHPGADRIEVLPPSFNNLCAGELESKVLKMGKATTRQRCVSSMVFMAK